MLDFKVPAGSLPNSAQGLVKGILEGRVNVTAGIIGLSCLGVISACRRWVSAPAGCTVGGCREYVGRHSNAVEALQLKRDEVKVKSHGISFASEDEWEGLKAGTEHALGEVRTMFHEAISKIK